MLGYFFNPIAGFSPLGHFIGLFLIIVIQVLVCYSVTKLLGHFNAGLFFNPIAGFSQLGHFIWLFLISVNQVLGS